MAPLYYQSILFLGLKDNHQLLYLLNEIYVVIQLEEKLVLYEQSFLHLSLILCNTSTTSIEEM